MSGLWLSGEDLERLAQLIGEVRHREAVPILHLLQQIQQRHPSARRMGSAETGTAHAGDVPSRTAQVANGSAHAPDA